MPVKNLAVYLSLILAIGAVAAESQATPITYIFSGTGSGSLGGSAFSLVPFTITSKADTSQISLLAMDVYQVPDLAATVEITGFAPATFTIPTINVANNTLPPGTGFSAPGQNLAVIFIFPNGGAGLDNYHLNTSFGPITGPTALSPNGSFATSAGDFVLSSVDMATFQAVVLPEPSIYLLVTTGAAALLTIRRRKSLANLGSLQCQVYSV